MMKALNLPELQMLEIPVHVDQLVGIACADSRAALSEPVRAAPIHQGEQERGESRGAPPVRPARCGTVEEAAAFLDTLPDEEIRQRQDLCAAQLRYAWEARADRAMEFLRTMEEDLRLAMERRLGRRGGT